MCLCLHGCRFCDFRMSLSWKRRLSDAKGGFTKSTSVTHFRRCSHVLNWKLPNASSLFEDFLSHRAEKDSHGRPKLWVSKGAINLLYRSPFHFYSAETTLARGINRQRMSFGMKPMLPDHYIALLIVFFIEFEFFPLLSCDWLQLSGPLKRREWFNGIIFLCCSSADGRKEVSIELPFRHVDSWEIFSGLIIRWLTRTSFAKDSLSSTSRISLARDLLKHQVL